MNEGIDPDPPRTWQTDRVKVLDTREFINSASRVLKGGVPGTNKQYDAQKVASDLVEMVFGELADAKGVQVETALATLGALAGFSVQMALREAVIKTGKMPEDKVFAIVKTNDGKTYYFGDLPNEGLFENKPGSLSLYNLVGGAAQQSGAKGLPNVRDISAYVARTVGSDAFGIPRLPPGHMPRKPPIELLDKFWNPVRNFLVVNVQAPLHWPLVIGLAAQKVIVMAKGAIDPELAAKIVMETAIPMAKVHPATVHFAYFQSY
jgi:hypothetical protein